MKRQKAEYVTLESAAEACAREGVENMFSDKNIITPKQLHSIIKMTYKLGFNFAFKKDMPIEASSIAIEKLKIK